MGRVLSEVSAAPMGRRKAPRTNSADARLYSHCLWNGWSPGALTPPQRSQSIARADSPRAAGRARLQPAHRTVGIEKLEPRQKRPGISQRPNAYRAVMIVLVNPRSARWKHRVPMSILSLATLLEDRYSYEIIDGNF